jgi:sulfur carrier protein ThiS
MDESESRISPATDLVEITLLNGSVVCYPTDKKVPFQDRIKILQPVRGQKQLTSL